jgi:hypothetical protein
MYFRSNLFDPELLAHLSALRPDQGSGKADLRPNLGSGLLHSKKAFM